MGVKTYPKSGQVSQKDRWSGASGKPAAKEHMMDRFSEVPTMCEGGATDAFERRYMRDFRKESLPEEKGETYS